MEYEEFKDFVSEQLPKVSKVTTMKKVIKQIGDSLYTLKNKAVQDLEINEDQDNISANFLGSTTGFYFTIGDRRLEFDYDGNETINCLISEPGVLQSTLIDQIIFKDGKAVHINSGEQFDIKSVESYLDWFKK